MALPLTEFAVARMIHVLAVVLWIGGVGWVTTVLLPEIRRSYLPAERFGVFHRLERRFARQARFASAIAGLSGLYMVWRLDLWDRFEHAAFWWMHAMVCTWLVFTLLLFVLEPLGLDRVFLAACRARAGGDHGSDRVAPPRSACAEPCHRRRRGGRQPCAVAVR